MASHRSSIKLSLVDLIFFLTSLCNVGTGPCFIIWVSPPLRFSYLVSIIIQIWIFSISSPRYLFNCFQYLALLWSRWRKCQFRGQSDWGLRTFHQSESGTPDSKWILVFLGQHLTFSFILTFSSTRSWSLAIFGSREEYYVWIVDAGFEALLNQDCNGCTHCITRWYFFLLLVSFVATWKSHWPFQEGPWHWNWSHGWVLFDVE